MRTHAARSEPMADGDHGLARFQPAAVDSGIQRRTSPRFAVELDVSLGSEHNFYAGLAENLSAGGVFVATHMLKPVGERVELSIHLPDSDHPVCGIGQVRWVREYNEQSDV